MPAERGDGGKDKTPKKQKPAEGVHRISVLGAGGSADTGAVESPEKRTEIESRTKITSPWITLSISEAVHLERHDVLRWQALLNGAYALKSFTEEFLHIEQRHLNREILKDRLSKRRDRKVRGLPYEEVKLFGEASKAYRAKYITEVQNTDGVSLATIMAQTALNLTAIYKDFADICSGTHSVSTYNKELGKELTADEKFDPEAWSAIAAKMSEYASRRQASDDGKSAMELFEDLQSRTDISVPFSGNTIATSPDKQVTVTVDSVKQLQVIEDLFASIAHDMKGPIGTARLNAPRIIQGRVPSAEKISEILGGGYRVGKERWEEKPGIFEHLENALGIFEDVSRLVIDSFRPQLLTKEQLKEMIESWGTFQIFFAAHGEEVVNPEEVESKKIPGSVRISYETMRRLFLNLMLDVAHSHSEKTRSETEVKPPKEVTKKTLKYEIRMATRQELHALKEKKQEEEEPVTGPHMVIVLSDNGIGLPNKLLELGRFTRGVGGYGTNSTISSGKMGLALQQELFEAQGGKIRFQNIEKNGVVIGAQIKLFIPIAA